MERKVSKLSFKRPILFGAIPLLCFWLAVGVAFLVYPEDSEASSNLIQIMVGAGAIAGVVLIGRDLRNYLESKNS